MGTPVTLLFSLVVLCIPLLQFVEGDAVIRVTFRKYENPKGIGANGHCCDGKWGICQSNGCDHRFIICMGNYTSSNKTDKKHCPLGRFQSDRIENQNNNTFSRTIADLRNPLLFNVTGRLPDGIALKVDVLDYDGTSRADPVDLLIYRSGIKLNSKYVLNLVGTTKAKTRLYAEMEINCVNKTVGQRCESKAPKCAPPGRNDHYTCEKYTGKKICTDGYMGKNCELPPRGTPSGPSGPSGGRPSGPSRPNSFPGSVPSGPSGGRPSPGTFPGNRPSGGSSVPGIPSPGGGRPAPGGNIPSPSGPSGGGPALCPSPGPGDHFTCDTRTGIKTCTDGYTGPNCDIPPPGSPTGPKPNMPSPSGPSPNVPSPSGPKPHLPSPSGPSPNIPSPSGPQPNIPSPSGPRPNLPSPSGPSPNVPGGPACEPPRSYDHYTCDPTTGRKICQHGYTGVHCEIPPTPPNTPTCEPPRAWDHYYCDRTTGQKICLDGYTGVHCEIPPRAPPSTSGGSANCKPPTAWDHYKCDPVTGYPVCNPGWTGADCKDRLGSSYRPSSSGGSSYRPGSDYGSDRGGSSYPGSSSRLCPTPRIGDHYICDSDFVKKICIDGYTGTNCDRPPLSRFPSSNGGFPSMPSTSRFGNSRHATDLPARPDPGNPASRAYRPTFPSYIGQKADCDRIAELERDYRGVSGIYKIQPKDMRMPIPVYCIMTTDGRGWTQIQRREENGLARFNKNWAEYKEGFGEVGRHAEEWIGLENLYLLTKQRNYKLRIDMKFANDNGRWRYAEYSSFSVGSEAERYALRISGYDRSSTAGDALQGDRSPKHNGMAFSTPDRDNDNDRGMNCAQNFQSGWWFNACFFSNLNGPSRTLGDCDKYGGKCISWIANGRKTVVAVRMAILPTD